MACGLNKSLESLKNRLNSIEDFLSDNITDSIENLSSTLEDATRPIRDEIRNIISQVDTPKSLHNIIENILEQFDKPVDIARELARELDQFIGLIPNPNEIIRDILSGRIDSINICKLVPNIEIDGDEVVLKSSPTTSSEKDAKQPIKKTEIPILKESIILENHVQSDNDIFNNNRKTIRKQVSLDSEEQSYNLLVSDWLYKSHRIIYNLEEEKFYSYDIRDDERGEHLLELSDNSKYAQSYIDITNERIKNLEEQLQYNDISDTQKDDINNQIDQSLNIIKSLEKFV